MTLTIKQSDLYKFERMVSKLVKPSDAASTKVCLITSDNGAIKLAAFCKDAILTMVVGKTGFINPFSTTLDAIKPIALKKDVDMTFEIQGNSVHVRYGVEQSWLPCNDKVNTLPQAPKQTVTNSKKILDALHSASKCTDPNSVRFALGGICLRDSQVIATSGVQLVAMRGFEFPFKDDVICPASKIFASKELLGIDTDEVLVGQIDNWICFSVGPVVLWLRTITDGKFPKVDKIMEPAENLSYLEIHPTDSAFLLDHIGKLPGSKEAESPIVLAGGQQMQVRAYDQPQNSGTTLVLSHSLFTGEKVAIALNRLFLKNALQFGCLHIGIDPIGTAPVIATGGETTFVCMSLDKYAEPQVDSAKVNTITSAMQPVVATPAKVDAPPIQKRRRKVATKSRNTSKPIGNTALLESAEQIRTDLRNSLVQVSALIKEVKAQRNKDRLIQNTMDSLRKLNLNIV